MATTSGRQSPPVVRGIAEKTDLQAMLRDEPFRVHFFQAVRLLQRSLTDRKPVGYFYQPQEEAIRFASLPSLGFPPSELHDLEELPSGHVRMTVQFMGLCAALSALPATYVEAVLERLRAKDRAMADFYDLFNHRMVSLFYRAWQKHRFYIDYEARQDDKLSLRLLDLLGLGTGGMRHRATISDRTCVFYAGLLGRHVRTADSLRQILEDYFDVPVTVHQFSGAWRRLPHHDQTFLSGWGALSDQLGVGVVVGDEVWDTHGRIEIALGPMGLEQYKQFLPGQRGHHELAAWMQHYSDGSYETQVRLILRAADVPPCALSAAAPAGVRLGLISWLKTKPRAANADEATYLLHSTDDPLI